MKTFEELINEKIGFFETINQTKSQRPPKDNAKPKQPPNKIIHPKSQIKLYGNSTQIVSSSFLKPKKSSKSLNSTNISTAFEKYTHFNRPPLMKLCKNKPDQSFTFSFHPQINNHSRMITAGLKPSYDQPIKSKKSFLNKSGFISLRDYSPYNPKEHKSNKDILGKVFLSHRNIVLQQEARKATREKYLHSVEKDREDLIHSKPPTRFNKEKFDKFINVNNKKAHYTERMLFEKRKAKETKELKMCTFKPLLSHLNISVDEPFIKKQIPFINDYVKLHRSAFQSTNHLKTHSNTSRDIQVSKRKYIMNNAIFIFN